MLQSFLEKGDFCWHCHTGIFSYPMWVAIRYNIPLIFGMTLLPNILLTIIMSKKKRLTKRDLTGMLIWV